MIIGKKVWNIISMYGPQVGRPQNEKEAFLEELETILDNIPRSERILIGGDFNAHLGARNQHYLEEHGQFEFGEDNEEGDRLLELMQAHELYAVNTVFKKRKEHMVTYCSGGRESHINYILVRREDKNEVRDAKVLPYEAVTRQHKLVVSDLEVPRERKSKQRKRQIKNKSMEVER